MNPGVKSSFNIRPPAQKNHLLWKGCLILRSSTNHPLCTQVRVQRQWTSTIPFMALMPPSEQCFSSAHGLGLARRTSSVRVTCPANQAVPRNPPVWDRHTHPLHLPCRRKGLLLGHSLLLCRFSLRWFTYWSQDFRPFRIVQCCRRLAAQLAVAVSRWSCVWRAVHCSQA